MSVTHALANDAVVDLGGSFINTDHDDMLGLVKEFGLTLVNRREDAERQPLSETGYYFAGRAWSEEEVAEHLRPRQRISKLVNETTTAALHHKRFVTGSQDLHLLTRHRG